tara:strand:+ start:1554 stop:2264 length:711 start_codon:yes stop_codon:yes gene_type:complete
MELFYLAHLEADQLDIAFSTEESKHINKVLRKKVGEKITVTNGKGLEWVGEITHSEARKVTAKNQSTHQHKYNDANLHIAIAPTKSNDRMEWFLEKVTEIGITQITPIICDHSERKVIKPERMKKILVGAIKQSAQFHLPQLNPACSFKKFMEKDVAENKLIAHCREGIKKELHQIKNLNAGLIILIGPEGDFSEKEIEMARNNAVTEISLGNQRLRTETAGIVASSAVATLRKLV